MDNSKTNNDCFNLLVPDIFSSDSCFCKSNESSLKINSKLNSFQTSFTNDSENFYFFQSSFPSQMSQINHIHQMNQIDQIEQMSQMNQIELQENIQNLPINTKKQKKREDRTNLLREEEDQRAFIKSNAKGIIVNENNICDVLIPSYNEPFKKLEIAINIFLYRSVDRKFLSNLFCSLPLDQETSLDDCNSLEEQFLANENKILLTSHKDLAFPTRNQKIKKFNKSGLLARTITKILIERRNILKRDMQRN